MRLSLQTLRVPVSGDGGVLPGKAWLSTVSGRSARLSPTVSHRARCFTEAASVSPSASEYSFALSSTIFA